MESYDLVVIGAGAGGLVTAAGAARLGLRAALVERKRFGGECLWTGCVPSKALIRAARVRHLLGRAVDFGLQATPGPVDFARVMARVRDVIRKIQPHDSPERFREMGVETVHGEARFTAPDRIEVNGRTLAAGRFCIATGASPFVPPIDGLNAVPYLTFETFFDQETLPSSLAILGGGPIGCELGQSFQRLGCRVTILEAADTILPRDDRETASVVADSLAGEGVELLTSTAVRRAESAEPGVRLTCERSGATLTVEAERLLVATGKRPHTGGLGLEAADVEVDSRGRLLLDRHLRSVSNPRVFACGDVAGSYQFTHYAAHQAAVVLFNAFSPMLRRTPERDVVPWCTYTDPELAHVGLTEALAKEKHGADVRVYRSDLGDNDRAIIEGAARGLLKLVTTRKGRLLGCTIVGENAGEMIHEAALALRSGLAASDLSSLIHAYPTFSESTKRAGDLFMGEKYLGGWIPRTVRWLARRRRPSESDRGGR